MNYNNIYITFISFIKNTFCAYATISLFIYKNLLTLYIFESRIDDLDDLYKINTL